MQNEYLGLLEQCMKFACEMMELCRGTQEVEAVLSSATGDDEWRDRPDPLRRLRMAIHYEEKKVRLPPSLLLLLVPTCSISLLGSGLLSCLEFEWC